MYKSLVVSLGLCFELAACSRGAAPQPGPPGGSPPGATASDAHATPVAPTPAVGTAAPPAPAGHAEAWRYEPDDRNRYVRTLVERPDDVLVAVGGSNLPGQSAITLLALDPAGKVAFDTRKDGPEVAPQQNGGAFALADGALFVAGQALSASMTYTLWLGRFAPDGSLTWEVSPLPAEASLAAQWTIPLAGDRALVALARGDRAAPIHELLVVSLTDGAVVNRHTAPGQVALPERHGDTWQTLVWTYPEAGPRSAPYTIDATSGELAPGAAAPPEDWKKPAGDAILVTSAALVGGTRLLVTRGETLGTPVMLIEAKADGTPLWRHFIEEPGFEQVTVLRATRDGGFAYVAERWRVGADDVRDPDGYRIVRAR